MPSMSEEQLEDLTRAAIAVFLDDERDDFMIVLNHGDNSKIVTSEVVVLTITRKHRVTMPLKKLEMAAV